MKLLHIPFSWHPDACGGTEVYVRALVRELDAQGISNVIVAPGEMDESADTDGLSVRRVKHAPQMTQTMMYGLGDEISALGFERVLDAEKPDLVHFHAYSPAVSVRWLEVARQRNIPCLYTYHTPTLACARGTLMRWGSIPCDGALNEMRCAACSLHGLGLGKAASVALTVASPLTQIFSSRVPFRILPLIQKRSIAVRRWLSGMSRIIALCEWGADVLKRNAVSAQRLRVVRHGLAVQGKLIEDAARNTKDGASLKVGFFGRLDRTKGLQVLIEALRRKPELNLELHCHLIADAAAREALFRDVRCDSRVFLHPPTPPEQVVHAMSAYDAVAVPSIWLETGPLVVLEAFEAGVPILGSDLGGIAEWVTHDQDGILMPAGDTEAWLRGLERFCLDEPLRVRLRAGVQAPPRMSSVAAQVLGIYREALTEHSTAIL